nr:DUF4007 family protein [Eubacterium sp.]
MARNYRLKGHGGFIMREGWFTKALAAVEAQPDVFTQDNFYGADILGIGTAMAKAVRYWLTVSGLIEERRGQGIFLTTFGEMVYKHDLYLEDDFTIWALHKNIVTNKEKATSWALFFQEFPAGEFTKEQLTERLYDLILQYSGEDEISERSFRDDCNTLLQMYTKTSEMNPDPEEKNQSIFAKLELIRKTYRGYRKEYADAQVLPKEIVLLSLADVLGSKGVNIEDLQNQFGGPGRVLGLSRVVLNDYLDELENEGYIRVHRTAGLDVVYPAEMPTGDEIVKKYYEKE